MMYKRSGAPPPRMHNLAHTVRDYGCAEHESWSSHEHATSYCVILNRRSFIAVLWSSPLVLSSMEDAKASKLACNIWFTSLAACVRWSTITIEKVLTIIMISLPQNNWDPSVGDIFQTSNFQPTVSPLAQSSSNHRSMLQLQPLIEGGCGYSNIHPHWLSHHVIESKQFFTRFKDSFLNKCQHGQPCTTLSCHFYQDGSKLVATPTPSRYKSTQQI